MFIILISMGCNSEPKDVYYFLDGYPELQFINKNGNLVPPDLFVNAVVENGITYYRVNNPSFTLTTRKTGIPYSGFIRTYHWDLNNIEAIFKEGKIVRLRYWYPNRQLGMDMNYLSGKGKAWNSSGALSIIWDTDETQYRNPTTGFIRTIIEGNKRYYFDFDGELSYYSVRTDSAVLQYFSDGTPRFYFPQLANGLRDGVVKRWYPNGQLRAIGQYKNGKEVGVWIEFDSLGVERDRVIYSEKD